MKKFTFLFFAAAAAVMFLAGCVNVETVKTPDLNKQAISETGAPIAHIDVTNWGIYLFMIPLLTGSTESVGSIDVLKDTVNAEKVVPVLMKESAKLKARQTLSVASQFRNTGFIFYIRNFNVSGNAVR